MINHKNFCRSLAKKGGTITLSLNYQPSIGAFSIGKEGNASGAPWEHAPKTGSVLGANFRRKRASGGRARGWGALPCNIVLSLLHYYDPIRHWYFLRVFFGECVCVLFK